MEVECGYRMSYLKFYKRIHLLRLGESKFQGSLGKKKKFARLHTDKKKKKAGHDGKNLSSQDQQKV
jgi:hypothetical protein